MCSDKYNTFTLPVLGESTWNCGKCEQECRVRSALQELEFVPNKVEELQEISMEIAEIGHYPYWEKQDPPAHREWISVRPELSKRISIGKKNNSSHQFGMNSNSNSWSVRMGLEAWGGSVQSELWYSAARLDEVRTSAHVTASVARNICVPCRALWGQSRLPEYIYRIISMMLPAWTTKTKIHKGSMMFLKCRIFLKILQGQGKQLFLVGYFF